MRSTEQITEQAAAAVAEAVSVASLEDTKRGVIRGAPAIAGESAGELDGTEVAHGVRRKGVQASEE